MAEMREELARHLNHRTPGTRPPAPPLTPAERATVERFEQAPDSLAEVLAEEQRYRLRAAMFSPTHNGHLFRPGLTTDGDIDPRWCDECGQNRLPDVEAVVARMVAEARAEGAAALTAAVREALPTYPPDWSEVTLGHVGLANRVRTVLDAADTTALERAKAEAADARPWSRCTGAGDCPESWHVHGCYADTGQCDDPLDHHDRAADAREAEVRERVERRLRAGDGIAGIRAALAPADNDGEVRQ